MVANFVQLVLVFVADAISETDSVPLLPLQRNTQSVNEDVVQERRRLTFGQGIVSTSCNYKELVGGKVVKSMADASAWGSAHRCVINFDPLTELDDSILSR